MVAFFRQFLVVLLVLLQFAAPLVHAHVDDHSLGHGLHLHEFEGLHFKADAIVMTSLTVHDAAQSAIVEVGSAIKIQQPSDGIADFALMSEFAFWPTQLLVEQINFSPQQQLSISEPFLSQNLSRAPPI
ncbi:MAG: hypothetical protein CTY19_14710 [Methylomonas sp.]|jgi:hypothetical protein|nr:MAG: hypothetical protein CTY19_14710 [Methylomonas sp.]